MHGSSSGPLLDPILATRISQWKRPTPTCKILKTLLATEHIILINFRRSLNSSGSCNVLMHYGGLGWVESDNPIAFVGWGGLNREGLGWIGVLKIDPCPRLNCCGVKLWDYINKGPRCWQ